MKNSNDNNEILYKQYDQGICRTWWKSHLHNDSIEDMKVNQLRKSLDLPLLSQALPEGYYDNQSVSKLWSIDFSPLDARYAPGFHNAHKATVLIIKGLGLLPLDEEMNVSGVAVVAADNSH